MHNNLCLFKLSSGEMVIAQKELFIIGQGYKVRSPMVVLMFKNSESDEGQVKIFLNRWVPFSDETEYLIFDRHIITMSSVDNEMSRYYVAAIATEKEYLEQQALENQELIVDWTPDEHADYKEETFESGEEGKVTPHPLMNKLKMKKDSKKVKPN